MAYNKKYAELGESVIDYVNDREDAIEQGFSDVDTDINGVSQELNDFKAEVADYVVEQGTNYTKWNSGKLECWGTFLGAVANSVSTTYPISFFGDVPTVDVSAKYISGVGATARYTYTGASTLTNIVCYVRDISTGEAPTAGNCSFSYYAIGRWK